MSEELGHSIFTFILYLCVFGTSMLCVKNCMALYRQRKANKMGLARIQLPMEREIAIGNDVYGVGSKFTYHPPHANIVHHCVVTSIGHINMTLENEIQSYCIEIRHFQGFFRSGEFRKYSISDGPIKHIMKHKFV